MRIGQRVLRVHIHDAYQEEQTAMIVEPKAPTVVKKRPHKVRA